MKRSFRIQLQDNIGRSSRALSRHLLLLHTAEVERWGASADAFPFFSCSLSTSGEHLLRIWPVYNQAWPYVCVRADGVVNQWASEQRCWCWGNAKHKRSAWFSSLLTKKCWHLTACLIVFFLFTALSAVHNLLLFFSFVERLKQSRNDLIAFWNLHGLFWK